MSIFTDLLGVFTDLTPDIIDIYIDLFGIPSDIYYAITVEDMLYDDHGKIKYKNIPDIKGQQLLIVNVIRSDALRGTLTQFDAFMNETRPFIITHEKKRLPPRTKIDVWFMGAKMSFQTEIDEVVNGVLKDGGDHSTILVKQILRPLT